MCDFWFKYCQLWSRNIQVCSVDCLHCWIYLHANWHHEQDANLPDPESRCWHDISVLHSRAESCYSHCTFWWFLLKTFHKYWLQASTLCIWMNHVLIYHKIGQVLRWCLQTLSSCTKCTLSSKDAARGRVIEDLELALERKLEKHRAQVIQTEAFGT